MSNLEIIALTLWWAEGSKSRRDTRWKNAVSYPIEITNTDPQIINIFVRYVTEVIGVDIHKFKLQLQIHVGDNKDELETYWSEITGIARSKFNKTIIRPAGRKPGKSKGTCKVRFSDKVVYNTLQEKLKLLLDDISGCGAVG